MQKLSIRQPIESIADDCVNCGICVKECAFLREYGSPQKLALHWLEDKEKADRAFPFECSLCGLCHGVCPKELDPSAMFLAMRRELVEEGNGVFKQHKVIRAYEKRGSSNLFSWFHFPKGCNTVLFPGCALPGSRPQTLLHLFRLLQESIPDLGIALDCCTKPSHDLGDNAHFKKMFNGLSHILKKHSIHKVLVACPNCYRIFKEYGRDFEVQTVYEILELPERQSVQVEGEVTVHDPCGLRFAGTIQESVRGLVEQRGLTIREMKHSRSRTFCCGEGGSAGFMRPEFATGWTTKRVAEAAGNDIVCYCAGCSHFLGKCASTPHVLDLCFFTESVMAGKQKVSKAPLTYWNRYRLKQTLRKELHGGVSGTRAELGL